MSAIYDKRWSFLILNVALIAVFRLIFHSLTSRGSHIKHAANLLRQLGVVCRFIRSVIAGTETLIMFCSAVKVMFRSDHDAVAVANTPRERNAARVAIRDAPIVTLILPTLEVCLKDELFFRCERLEIHHTGSIILHLLQMLILESTAITPSSSAAKRMA